MTPDHDPARKALNKVADDLDSFVHDMREDGNDASALWLEYRVKALRRLAAQNQKPTSVRLEARPAGSDKDWIEIFPSQLSGMAKVGHDVRAIEIDPPPAAGWNIPEQITPELACILEQCGPPEMQTPEAVSTLVRDYQPIWAEIVKTLRHNAPPDTGAGESEPITCDFMRSFPDGTADNSTYGKIEDELDKIEAPFKDANGKWLSLHERIAAIPLPPHGGADAGVGVKPLEWETRAPGTLVAKTEIGSYRIYAWTDGVEWILDGFGDRDRVSSIDAAKAAAQADYERRILSALSHQPAPVAANASAVATYRLGRWLAAALEDPNVCAEMKADIDAWIDAGQPNVQPSTNASAEARLREALANAITTLGQMCDGSNWPEFAQQGEGFRAYTHACEIAKTLADELFEEAAGTRPIPSVSCDTHSEQQRNTLGVTAGRDRPQSTHPHASDCDKQKECCDLAAKKPCADCPFPNPDVAMRGFTDLERTLLIASKAAHNYIANTESELGMTLKSGDLLRAAIAKAEACEIPTPHASDCDKQGER